MVKLDIQYKLSLAKTFTELAIQNDLICKYDNASDTANAVCDFFQTIVDNLDNKSDE